MAHFLESSTGSAINGAKWFHSLDLAGAFLAVPVERSSVPKLGVTTPRGLFQMKRMGFGLKNAGNVYSRLMGLMLHDMIRQQRILSFFDDHLIPMKSFTDGLFKLIEFFFAVEIAGVKISPEKTNLFKQTANWLGHTIDGKNFQPDQMRAKSISEWPVPRNVKELRTFVGKATYYRRFVKDFATISHPLNNLTRKGVVWSWDHKCQQAFLELKRKLSNAPLLAHADFESNNPFILDTDASNVGLGGVLSQKQADGTERPIMFMSQSLTKAERQYSVTKKELLAVVTMVEKCKYFLLGRHFKIRTDHASLQWLMSSKAVMDQCFRWQERLSQFDFEIIHRPGRAHSNADGLSRMPHPQIDEEAEQSTQNMQDAQFLPLMKSRKKKVCINTLSPANPVDEPINPDFKAAQQNDEDCRTLFQAINNKTRLNKNHPFHRYQKEIGIRDGILVFQKTKLITPGYD